MGLPHTNEAARDGLLNALFGVKTKTSWGRLVSVVKIPFSSSFQGHPLGWRNVLTRLGCGLRVTTMSPKHHQKQVFRSVNRGSEVRFLLSAFYLSRIFRIYRFGGYILCLSDVQLLHFLMSVHALNTAKLTKKAQLDYI